MTNIFRLRRAGSVLKPTALEQILFFLSAYAVPCLLVVVSLISVLLLRPNYVTPDVRELRFKVISEGETPLLPAEALTKLQSQLLVSRFDTHLAQQPFWYSVAPRLDTGALPSALEFPSRHAVQTSCWDASTLVQLGEASRNNAIGGMQEIKAGFSLTLPQDASSRNIVCRATFVGPARLSIQQLPLEQLQTASQEFHRNSGLLDGGLIVLSMFVLIAALINRNSNYVVFAAWLIVNLRMASISVGWDTQWLGHALPPEWMAQIRAATVAIYYLMTVALFSVIFKEDITKVGHQKLLSTTQYSCVPLLVFSLLLPFNVFLPLMWIASGWTICILIFFLVRILKLTRSPVAMWYSASVGITLAASLYEVIAASLGFQNLITTVNSVTAALSSSLLAALAIAQQMRIEHSERIDAQAELQHTYEAMPIGLFTLDLNGRFLSANPALVSMLGANVTAAERNIWSRYFHLGAWERLFDMVKTRGEGELEIRRYAGQGCEISEHSEKIIDADGLKVEQEQAFPTLQPRIIQTFLVKAILARGKIEGTMQDVTEQLKATEDLRFMANNDPLTKVLNRRGIEHKLQKAIDRLATGNPLALAYLDLDRFKLINDLYGHATGDEVLKQVCERVQSMLTDTQHIGRVGGDEFVVVLADTPIALASWICSRIVNAISSAPFRIGDKAFQVRGSVGLIEVSAGTQSGDAMATADSACRAAKNGRVHNLVVYEKNAPAFRDRETELDLIERLSAGNAPEGLFIEMQPIMSLRLPHESLNFEVLLRMHDHDGSVIPAYRIIAAAENSGRISVLDRWVLNTTLTWLDENQPKLARTQFVCMNLSGGSLNDERFVQDAFSMLSKNLHVSNRLCIEITESVALHDLDNTRRFIDKVRSYGVKVALDDFGAGYTSFSYLRELPADIIKIDGSFIVDMNQHPANIAIVEAIVSLAMNLGMKTIAEWAEDNATVQTLTEIGVDYVQGFVVARPQSPSKILTAASSASFIKDEALARFVRSLGGAANNPMQIDLIETMRVADLH